MLVGAPRRHVLSRTIRLASVAALPAPFNFVLNLSLSFLLTKAEFCRFCLWRLSRRAK